MTWFDQPTLRGKHVHLEPLTPKHAEGLHKTTADPAIFTWLSIRQPKDVAETAKLVDAILNQPGRLAWAQIDANTGEVAGTTSYYQIDSTHRNLNIGYTWIGRGWQRTALNTEAKLLLLQRAFDDLKAHRVAWETDIGNERSQRAIERLGAQREGVLRAHRVRPDGTLRDTVVYSLTGPEWPAVRNSLTSRV
ncbi:GNAT family N-acetyltransferase [Amycolatopsis sp. NPDC059657]|uniref:GNAT family N-acetyltransferase n=1 Tax=Amycolatopsis sp. NPDC059657 TaxID=3346899 RepID=UPI00366D54FA